jgi:hypothetical protein
VVRCFISFVHIYFVGFVVGGRENISTLVGWMDGWMDIYENSAVDIT